ncbi:MAG: ABC transporter permease [Eubacteriales bacterium]|nr:ABC transporter permease [Eubacteriales bacterium]
MFWNIYKKSILRSLRSKEMVIWTAVFPIMLSTLFYFAFSSLDKNDMLDSIPVAIVRNQEYEQEKYFQEMVEELSDSDDALLDVKLVDEEKDADLLLKEGEITGYITIDHGAPGLFVKGEGMSQTVLKNILDRYIQTKDTVENIVKSNPLSALGLIASGKNGLTQGEAGVEEISFTSRKPSSVVHYYYALLAMTCLYGGFYGVMIIEAMQANLSPQGARGAVSPGSKWTIFGASFLASLTALSASLFIVVCYMQFILGVGFGGQFFYALLTCFVGGLVGIAFGCLIALPSRWKGGFKTAVVVGISMICCFFAGLMIGGINYIVSQSAPVLSMINPAARISDAFYCLYYYDDHIRYFQNLGILVVMAAVMLGIVLVFTGRKQYESI